MPSREENISSLDTAVQHNFRCTLMVPFREDNISSLGAAVQHNFRRTWCHLGKRISVALALRWILRILDLVQQVCSAFPRTWISQIVLLWDPLDLRSRLCHWILGILDPVKLFCRRILWILDLVFGQGSCLMSGDTERSEAPYTYQGHHQSIRGSTDQSGAPPIY